MTLEKTKLLESNYDRIFKMHVVYTLVGLKSDQIGFLIVGLAPLDYSIDSPINPAFIH